MYVLLWLGVKLTCCYEVIELNYIVCCECMCYILVCNLMLTPYRRISEANGFYVNIFCIKSYAGDAVERL